MAPTYSKLAGTVLHIIASATNTSTATSPSESTPLVITLEPTINATLSVPADSWFQRALDNATKYITLANSGFLLGFATLSLIPVVMTVRERRAKKKEKARQEELERMR